MTVHDEILASVPADNAAQWFEEIKRAASTPAVWMTDLPLGVDGWIGKRFRKD